MSKNPHTVKDCIFCKIVRKEIPSNLVYEDDEFLAFEDINPQSPVHALIIPKSHIKSLNDIDEKNSAFFGKLMLVARNIAEERGVSKTGYRVVLNCGIEGGQTVFHLHVHILGGRRMVWPPG